MKRMRLLVMASIVTMTCTTAARATTLQFDAILDGLQETPPVATPGYGDGTLFLNDVTGDYTISGNFADLIGTANNAHIHGPAPPGTPAGVVVGLTFTPSTSGTFSGAGTFTAPQMADLTAGLYYINIHSTFRSGGEIRGQLGLVPEPGSVVLLGLAGIGLLAAAWRRRKVAG